MIILIADGTVYIGSYMFSSSVVVYGNNTDAPFKEDLPVDFFINPYMGERRL
jgi:UDP-glucose 4-epimerase